MRRVIRLCQSTIGLKVISALTGIILFGWVFLHMVGNLKAFLAPTADGEPDIDVYAAFLKTMGEPLLPHGFALWSARGILLVSAVLHVVSAIKLALRNRAARPIRYHHKSVRVRTTVAARTMLVSGVLIVIYVIFHLMQFTWGWIKVTPFTTHEIYHNLYYAFEKWFFVLTYVVAMALLAFHLYHGAWSLFQTLGIDNPDRNRLLRLFAVIAAGVMFLGFASVPVMFFIGALPAPPIHGGP